MRSLQSLTPALVALSIATGIATPSPTVAAPSTNQTQTTLIARPVASRATTTLQKAAITWLSPITDTNQFERYFEQCANAAPEEALSACEQATTLEPDVAIAWDNLGAVLEQLGRYEDALTALNRAVTLTPNDANIWYNVGVVLAKLHQYESSVAAFEEAYRLNPEDELARKYAELLRDQFGN
jgi:tetratricopeptide (TPR) repeat protein